MAVWSLPMLARFSTWLADAAARRPSGWIGRYRFGGSRGAPHDHEQTFDRVLEAAGGMQGRICLDLGCGGGRLLERVLQAGAAAAAGIDHSPDMIALTRRRNAAAAARGALELETGDLAALPWPEATFDVVLCANVFFFVAQPQVALGEIVRVLRPAGRFVLATAQGPLPRLTLRYPSLYLWGRQLHVYTDERMRGLLEKADFEDVRVESVRGLQVAVGSRPG